MIKINLLPVRAAAKRETLRVQISIAVMMLALVLIVGGYMEFSIRSKIGAANDGINVAEAELVRLNEIKKKVDAFEKASDKLEKKLGVIKGLNSGRTSAVYFMDELSNVMPEKLWLETVKQGKKGILLNGLSVDHDTIAKFMLNMERSPMFSDIKLKGTQQSKGKTSSFHKFNLLVKFQPPKPKEN